MERKWESEWEGKLGDGIVDKEERMGGEEGGGGWTGKGGTRLAGNLRGSNRIVLAWVELSVFPCRVYAECHLFHAGTVFASGH